MNKIFDKKRLPKSQVEESAIKQKHTIMIVDDEEQMLKSLESMFNEDYKIITARGGQEALNIIKKEEYPENISVIIADQRMPGIKGVQLFIQLKDIIPDTLRIILTAFDDKEVIKEAINEAQIYQFILKNFDPDELKLRIKCAVDAFELQRKVVEAGYTDYLTEMWNRRFLYERIGSSFSMKSNADFKNFSGGPRNSELSNNSFIFLLLDLDNFKEINDTYGHSTGDKVLKQFTEIIHNEFRKSDFIIRWGGDEFLMVLKYSSLDQVITLAERFCREVSKKTFDLGNNETRPLTCSIGFAAYPFLQTQSDLFTWEEVFDIADIALYAAKNSGRNGWVGIFSTDKVNPDNLYRQNEKGKKKMLPNIEQLLENGELDVQTSLSDKKSLIWRKPVKNLDLSN
ncbi:MAG TPA: diguanylate cyclase [Candidatus Kapabacteria bacterium]|nr:diguanylate cyclase [Candidatus Kapabacteria bacterium]